MKLTVTYWLSVALASRELSSSEKLAGAAIAYSIQAGADQIAHRQLGEAYACSPRSAMRAVRALERLGWLTVTRTSGEANVYALCLPEAPQQPRQAVRS